VKKNKGFATVEAKTYSGRVFSSTTPFLTALDATISMARTAAIGKASPYAMYYYVPASPAVSQWGGSVIRIGRSPGFVFFDGGASSYNSMAHELGHSLDLRHPSDPSNTRQFAPHLLTGLSRNIMPSDPLNLMGYNPNKPARTPIRYHQWKTCSRS